MSKQIQTDLNVFSCKLEGTNLIEASAGTGKTWNICGLYLRLLLEKKMEVQQILVVTFTKAATAELQERIRSRIAETLTYLETGISSKDPFVLVLIKTLSEFVGLDKEEMRQRLDIALQNFDEAAIYTIHGFCQRALADTPFAAGLPFTQTLVEGGDELMQEEVKDFWRKHIASDGLGEALAVYLCQQGDTPESWAGLLSKYQQKPLARVEWPEDAEIEDVDLSALEAAFTICRGLWEKHGSEIKERLQAALDDSILNGQSYKAESLNEAYKELSAYLGQPNALSKLDLGGKGRLLRSSVLLDKTKKEARNKCLTPQHAFFDEIDTLFQVRESADKGLHLARLNFLRRMLEDTDQSLRQCKREHRVFAFDDLLYNVHVALTSPESGWLAGALRSRYPAALIDEFQDTDPLQFAIFNRIYNDEGADGASGPLFLVGDPKQAIYKFRNADLHTYLQAQAQVQSRYTLRENQRSVSLLIDSCNALFQANQKAFILPGLDYEAVLEGKKPRKVFADANGAGHGPALQVWRIPNEGDDYLERSVVKERATQATAAEIARLISDGQNGNATLGGKPLQPGHIAVLVKSHAQGGKIKAALATLGVGSVELAMNSIFESPDAEELERVLLAVREPGRPTLLHAALATELMGFDATSVAQFKDNESALLERVSRFVRYREAWMGQGAGIMLRQWMDEEGVPARMLLRKDGERRLTNLLHLAELLHQASEDHPSPDTLLRWFSTQRRQGNASEVAQVRLESDRNLVQIVTIHKSKGLEYPVVFCPFLWDGYPHSDQPSVGCEYHDGNGDLVVDFRPDACASEDIKQQQKAETSAEFLRLVYVAMTRAVHRCYLVAGCYLAKHGRNAPSTTQSTHSLLNWLVAGNGQSYEDWQKNKLMPAEIEQAWSEIAKKAGNGMSIADLPDVAGTAVALSDINPDDLHAQTPPAPIWLSWRLGSFSSMLSSTHREPVETSAADHDEAVAPSPLISQPLGSSGVPDTDILLFPKGASAGTCIHRVFEEADFTDASTWDNAVVTALDDEPQVSRNGEPTEQKMKSMLKSMLKDVMDTPLPNGVKLGKVCCRKKLVELKFHMPSDGLRYSKLNTWLKNHGYAVPLLESNTLNGYLKGAIDLVFEWEGRYYLLDWKSNHLGFTPDEYGAEQVEEAMAEHGYHLQRLIYSVALHRFLKKRLVGYDPEKHLGGAYYLFIRAVRPEWKADGQAAGVFYGQPSLADLESFDALLRNSEIGVAA